jgi:hypothetical protein
LLATAQWKIDEDNTDLGFLRVFITYDPDKHYRLIIGYRDPERPPYSLLTFGLFPDSEEHLEAFNSTFHSVAEAIAQYIGAPTVSGSISQLIASGLTLTTGGRCLRENSRWFRMNSIYRRAWMSHFGFNLLARRSSRL